VCGQDARVPSSPCRGLAGTFDKLHLEEIWRLLENDFPPGDYVVDTYIGTGPLA